MSNNKQINVLKQLFDNLQETDKDAFLKLLLKEGEETTSEVTQKVVSVCPHCGSKHFVKNGATHAGSQRYLCRDCHKSFVEDSGTILYYTQKSLGTWQKYIKCMLDKLPLRRCADECGISLPTAFAWRHKILDALQNMMNSVTLDGVVEADETFFRISYKGNHKKSLSFQMPRAAKKRGTAAKKRGISKEQVCVPCGVNLDGKSVAQIANLGKPCVVDIQKVLGGHIEPETVFVTDALRAYQKISYDMGLEHIRIPRKKRIMGVFNIQTINSYHARLKDLVLGVFHGVATKYLNNYLVYHNFVNFAKEPRKEKQRILMNFIRETFCVVRTADIPCRAAVPV